MTIHPVSKKCEAKTLSFISLIVALSRGESIRLPTPRHDIASRCDRVSICTSSIPPPASKETSLSKPDFVDVLDLPSSVPTAALAPALCQSQWPTCFGHSRHPQTVFENKIVTKARDFDLQTCATRAPIRYRRHPHAHMEREGRQQPPGADS